MNYAVIDLGSNTIRLSVYECDDKQIHKTFSEKGIAGLAGYVSNGILEINGIQKACVILKRLIDIASKFVEPSNIYLFATASLRNVSNKEEAASIISQEISLIPEILDGKEEAALGFAGASKFTNCDNGIMIDIGGASTELVLFEDHEAVDLVSLPIGCLNLSAGYVKKIIPTEKERKQIKNIINSQLEQVDWNKKTKYPIMVGTGGTLRAVLKLACLLFDLPEEENSVSSHHVQKIIKLIQNNKNNIFQAIYKSIPERLMTISTGLAILQQTAKKFGCATISVSKFGVREGYLLDRVLSGNGHYSLELGCEDN